MSGLFRSWKPSPTGKDPEIQRLEKEAAETRQKIAALREQGRQRRAHRLQSLDALETRRMTLLEILKRMDKELADKNVDDYADVLAEVFGERKIFAHRAIGLEALLCQFMHQMLAKQHQLKIMKRSGKELQKLCQTHKNRNREEFHSYEALAVHLETMRLSLEAQYDDIFAAQHSLLARLHHVEAGGTMTNYKIVKPGGMNMKKKAPKKPTLTVSKKHSISPKNKAPTPTNDTGESDDDDALMQSILIGKDEELHDSRSEARKSTDRRSDAGGNSNSKSARDRRREIEQKRLASGRGSNNSSSSIHFEETDKDKVREKMRELEAQRAGRSGDELQERRSSRRSSSRRSETSPKNDNSSQDLEASQSSKLSTRSKDEEVDDRQRRRQERRDSRAAARASATASS